MPKPKTKPELLSAASESYENFVNLIDRFSPKQQQAEFPFLHRDRCIRDVVGHILEWQLMFLDWHRIGQQGNMPEMPAVGYSWRETPELNAKIHKKYCNAKLIQLRRELDESHQQILDLILHYNEAELFEKRRYAWTGSTSLAAYLISATSAHYHWATKLLKKVLRTLPKE